jgi:hypothetical protein
MLIITYIYPLNYDHSKCFIKLSVTSAHTATPTRVRRVGYAEYDTPMRIYRGGYTEEDTPSGIHRVAYCSNSTAGKG